MALPFPLSNFSALLVLWHLIPVFPGATLSRGDALLGSLDAGSARSSAGGSGGHAQEHYVMLAGVPALGNPGLGNKHLISLLSLPVRQDLKIQLEWEPLIAAVLACCSCPVLMLHGSQMEAKSGG